MVDQSTKTHQRQDSEHIRTLFFHFLQCLQVTWGLCVIRTTLSTVSTDHQRGTKRFEQSLPTRDPSPFTINVLDTGATDQKKKDSRRHWSTSYRRTQNDFICVCNLHLKWLPDKRYNLLSQYRSFPTSRTFRNNAATCRSFPEVPPPPPHFGRPGVTPRPPAQFTDQLLQTWMLLDMATFELEKFNTKKCLVQSRFYFLKKEEEEEEITHILKKVKELVVNWTEALEQLQHRTCSIQYCL